jgi:uncharacterized protein with von Willebrand factor type A (vWA) domain
LIEAMSELNVIELALKGAARRRRWARGLHGLWHGLLIGAIVSLLIAGAYHLLPLPLWVLIAAAFAPLPFMLGGFIIGAWRKPVLSEVARWVDGRQHLQERLSTALEVSKQDNAGSWRDLILTDAAEHVKTFDPRKLVAFRLPKATRWAVVVLALVAGLGFVPEYRSKQFRQQQADRQNIKEVGKQLADLTRRSLDKRPPVLETTQKSMEAITNLAEQLARQPLTRSEALKDLANAAEKLKDQLKEMGKDPALKRLEQAARSSSGNDPQTTAGLQKQMESLQKQLGTPTGNPEAMEKMQKDLQKLQEAAKAMADKNSPGTDAEKQKMSQALAALSKQAQEMGLQLPQLEEAIAAMQADKTDLVLKDLQAATLDLEKTRDMAKSLQQMQQQMEKLGKDLAEQLKNGQPELAQQTLQKMSDQLKNSNLTPEQKQKLLQDVSNAIPPAGNYGQVSDKLKDAAKQMQSGDNPAASKSLADAAKELEKLAQQMGDAQQMMAELENLNKASQCVGTGQSWGMCNKPGSNPNGKNKPGGGVGTWADESGGWMYDGQWSDHWDNSGSPRPDMAGKGHTERDDGLNDALQPTKVKGQFSPGGQMPSITLKGVSIKGSSKVEYEAAAAAAQSDAQSALSQEKVPRAYQGAVRDYFDDLKK